MLWIFGGGILGCLPSCSDKDNRMEQTEPNDPDDPQGPQIPDDPNPVSYTHLDVYKRQAINTAVLRLSAELHQVGLDEFVQVAVHHPLDIRGLDSRTTVSYTHLDVYKRQA